MTHQEKAKQMNKFKTCCNIAEKAGSSLRMAAILGYRAGYSVGKHPELEKVKKTVEHHPKASIAAVLGLLLGMLGLLGFISRKIA